MKITNENIKLSLQKIADEYISNGAAMGSVFSHQKGILHDVEQILDKKFNLNNEAEIIEAAKQAFKLNKQYLKSKYGLDVEKLVAEGRLDEQKAFELTTIYGFKGAYKKLLSEIKTNEIKTEASQNISVNEVDAEVTNNDANDKILKANSLQNNSSTQPNFSSINISAITPIAKLIEAAPEAKIPEINPEDFRPEFNLKNYSPKARLDYVSKFLQKEPKANMGYLSQSKEFKKQIKNIASNLDALDHQQSNFGEGILYKALGYNVTNAHVLEESFVGLTPSGGDNNARIHEQFASYKPPIAHSDIYKHKHNSLTGAATIFEDGALRSFGNLNLFNGKTLHKISGEITGAQSTAKYSFFSDVINFDATNFKGLGLGGSYKINAEKTATKIENSTIQIPFAIPQNNNKAAQTYYNINNSANLSYYFETKLPKFKTTFATGVEYDQGQIGAGIYFSTTPAIQTFDKNAVGNFVKYKKSTSLDFEAKVFSTHSQLDFKGSFSNFMPNLPSAFIHHSVSNYKNAASGTSVDETSTEAEIFWPISGKIALQTTYSQNKIADVKDNNKTIGLFYAPNNKLPVFGITYGAQNYEGTSFADNDNKNTKIELNASKIFKSFGVQAAAGLSNNEANKNSCYFNFGLIKTFNNIKY
jgi:hypothetical protein